MIHCVMKKILFMLVMCISGLFANAQLLLEENFNYPLGDLEGQGAVVDAKGAWYKCFKSGDDIGTSAQVVAGILSYPGYPGRSESTVAKLDPTVGFDANSRISSKYMLNASGDTAKYSAYQKIYVSFLVNIAQDGTKTGSFRDFFTFEGSLTSSMTRGRLFAKVSTGGAITYGIAKNSTTPVAFDNTVSCGQTQLLVCVYNVNTADLTGTATGNDFIELYLNPDPAKTEADNAAVKVVSTDDATDYGASAGIAINLRQRGINARIGGLRVGTSWDDIMTSAPDPNTYTSKEIIHEQFNAAPWEDQPTNGNYNYTINVGTGTGTINLENCIINTTTNPAGAGASSPGRVQLQKTDSQTDPGIIELPEVPSCGSVKINANAGNVSKTFKLQEYIGDAWEDLTTFTTSSEFVDETAGTTCKALDFSYDVKSLNPVKLRLINNTSSSLYVYELWVTDYVKDDANAIKQVNADKGTLVATYYYTLTGIRVLEPVSGVYIQKKVYKNGAVEINKISKR